MSANGYITKAMITDAGISIKAARRSFRPQLTLSLSKDHHEQRTNQEEPRYPYGAGDCGERGGDQPAIGAGSLPGPEGRGAK